MAADLDAWIASLSETYGTISVRNVPSPTSEEFFSRENVLYVVEQIEDALHHLTGERVRVCLDDAFAQTLVDALSESPGCDPSAVALLNRTVIEREVRTQYLSLRHRKLFRKYWIEKDRVHHLPYGQYQVIKAGEVTVSPSNYMLSSPARQWRARYLSDVYGKDCARENSGASR